jgi:hypothetical protein
MISLFLFSDIFNPCFTFLSIFSSFFIDSKLRKKKKNYDKKIKASRPERPKNATKIAEFAHFSPENGEKWAEIAEILPKNGEKWAEIGENGSKTAQNTEIGGQNTEIRSQNAKITQIGLENTQNTPKNTQNGLKNAQNSSKNTQNTPKKTPNRHKTAQNDDLPLFFSVIMDSAMGLAVAGLLVMHIGLAGRFVTVFSGF